jgi:hypothetical protein
MSEGIWSLNSSISFEDFCQNPPGIGNDKGTDIFTQNSPSKAMNLQPDEKSKMTRATPNKLPFNR